MANKKATKRAMLTSALAVFMCIAMLVGTTFAWFTDSASTAVNKIQAGTLDIKLLDANGDSLEGQTLAWQKAQGAENETVLWEPGCTYNLQPITIKNDGNLALKYKI
ncbi:MAG: TasA family protein, partial [Firmicutes bacterium]|nr:TasA family protein [Bacillota bacterium]